MKKKVLLYGIEDKLLSLVEMFVSELSQNFSLHVARVGKQSDIMHEYENTGLDYVIFVGVYSPAEIEKAKQMGAKVFVIPFENPDPTDVQVSKFNVHKKISDQIESLRSEIFGFLVNQDTVKLVNVG